MKSDCPLYSLTETTEGYCLRTFNDRKKYFANYFAIAGDIYREIYRTILPTIISKYVEVIYDDAEPHPFIWKPDNLVKFFGVSVTNKHHELIQVFYNQNINVFTKPAKIKDCGCSTNSLCDCMDNLQVVITPKIINGTTYYIKQWLKCCPNGDVLQYSEVPVQDYDSTNGSYSDDYGDDYDILNEGENIVILKFTKNLGRLETKDCGCPLVTEHNKKLIYNVCGCFLPVRDDCCKRYHEKTIHCNGEMKFSECGTKIYLINVKADKGGYVVASYQTKAVQCGEEVFVDEYARPAIWAGIDRDSTVFNPRSGEGAKESSNRRYNVAKRELFEYINPLNRSRLFDSVTAELKW